MRFTVAAAAALLGAGSVSAMNWTVKVGADNGVRFYVYLSTKSMY